MVFQNTLGKNVSISIPEIKDGIMTFKLSSFSPIAVAAEKAASPTGAEPPKTADSNPPVYLFILIALAAIAIIGAAVFIVRRKKA
jgi:hypothetical protein